MIFQINLFVCDKCGDTMSVSTEEIIYDDPVIRSPEGWINTGEEDLCPKCMAHIVEKTK